MSSVKNEYILILNQKLANKTFEERQRFITKILEDIEPSGILEEPTFEDDVWDLNTPIGLQENEEADKFAKVEEIAVLDSDERVRRKREELITAGIIKPTKKKQKIVEESLIKRFGRNALHEAVLANDLNTVKKLLQNGVARDERDNNGNTPMDIALLEENIEAIKILKDF